MKKGQLNLNIYKGKHGGRRPGSGRKRVHSKGVAHRERERVKSRFPLHINFKVRIQIRNKDALRILKRAIMNSRSHGLKITQYSLQSNHVHLIVEATTNEVLSKGMRSLTITFAKGLKNGKIQMKRYHLHALMTLREVRNAVRYVLFNEEKHRNLKKAYVTPYSSLRFCKNLKALAKEAGIMIIIGNSEHEAAFLDGPQSWLQKRALEL